MKLLRNPEIRCPFIVSVIEVGIAVCAAALLLHKGVSPRVVLWLMIPAIVMCIGIFMTAAWLFVKKIRSFTLKAQRSLHGERYLQFDEFKEGDFATMKDAFQKMALAHAQQEDLLEAEKKLLQQSLADITHQLKTPLQIITGTTAGLLEENVSAAERKSAARTILDTSDHINDLVTTLLKLSRLDADAVTFRQERFTAEKLIACVCEPLEMIMELHDITLQTNIPADIEIESDLRWMTEALTNIVKNSMEHTPPGGTIFIDVNDNAVGTKIVIRDTGPGIDPEDRFHVFERFYRGKDAGPNSVGIGLSFSQRVIRGLGGDIELPCNHPEGGAVFTVQLKNKINV